MLRLHFVKLSSHALTFLQAQYRAIFKRAYIKGLATAVLLTAGLAAGQAQASATDGKLDGTIFQSASNSAQDFTVTADSTLDMADIEDSKMSGTWTFVKDLVIDGVDVKLTGAANRAISVEGGLTIQSGGTLTLSNTQSTNTQIFGGVNGNSLTLAVTGEDSALNINSASVNFNKAEINSGATVTLQGMVELNKKDAEKSGVGPDWTYYSNISANKSSADSGTITVDEATLNIKDQALLTADKTFNISGSTINFAGKEHVLGKDGDGNQITGSSYATAFLRAGTNTITDATLKIAAKGADDDMVKSQVNVADNAWGALYANKIEISDTDVKIGSGGTFVIDGNFTDRTQLKNEGQHSATKLSLEDVTFDNQGTTIIGNAQSGGTATVKGEVDLQGKVKNFATVTISGDGTTAGKLIISEDQILKQKDASGNAIEAGWFAGKASGIVLSGDSIEGATLQLVGTDANGLNLNKDVTFVSQDDVAGGKTAGKIYVQKSGTIAGEHFVLESALSLPTSGKLGLEADVFEIGTATGKTNTLADFGAELYAAHDRVVLEASGDSFTINKALNLSRDFYTKDDSGDYTTTSNGYGTIEGDNLSLGTSSASGALTIKGGAYRNEGQSLTLTSGSLTVGAEAADATGLPGNDGADEQGWTYYKNGNPASLTWKGKFILSGSDATKVSVDVTGAKGADATLDLTGARVEWGNGTITLSGSAKDFEGDHVSATDYFARAGFGTLAITGNQFSDFLELGDATATTTKMIVSGGGVLLVKGAVTGPINFNKFTSDSTPVAAGNVHFSGEGMLLSTGDLSLETGVDTDGDKDVEESEILTLNLGSGAIGAVGITINNRNPELNEADAELADDFVEVSGGALAVTSRFDSSNNEVKFNQSKLVLDSAFLSNYGVSTTASGVAAVHKLTFSGDGTASAGESAGLEVWAGDWTVGTGGTLGDIDLSGGAKIKVGNGHREFVRNGQTASLEADNVGIDGSGSIAIKEGGSATFNTLQAGTGASITVEDASLTLTGIVNETDITADSVPATLADIGTLDEVKAQAGIALNDATISVDGGSLILGDAAATALVKFSATEDPTTGYVAINDAIAEADITLTNAAVLKLDFSESSAAAINTGAKAGLITKEQARELKDELVDALERGSYINIGELGLDIIYDSGSMTAQWTDLKDFVHVVSGQVGNNVTERLLVQGITSSDNDISGQFGALEAATVGQNSIRVDGTLGLHEAREGYFVSQVGANGARSAVGLALNSYSDVTLHGEGTVGTLQGTSTSDDTLVIFKEGTYQPGTTTIEATTGSDGIVNVGRVEVDNDVLVKGDVKVGSLAVTKSLVADNVNLDGGANGTSAVFGSLEVAENLTVGSTNSNSLYVADGVVTAESLTLLNGSTLYVGWDGADADVKGTDIDESNSYSGEFYAGTVDLGQGGIVVDPAVTDPTAIAALGQFTNGTKYKNGVQSETSLDLGNANGNLFVGQNSALGLGFANKDELKAYIAAHQSNGALSEY